jgi:hypothetical protein
MGINYFYFVSIIFRYICLVRSCFSFANGYVDRAVVSVIPFFTNNKDEYIDFNAFCNQAFPKYGILRDVFVLLPSFLCVVLALFGLLSFWQSKIFFKFLL